MKLRDICIYLCTRYLALLCAPVLTIISVYIIINFPFSIGVLFIVIKILTYICIYKIWNIGFAFKNKLSYLFAEKFIYTSIYIVTLVLLNIFCIGFLGNYFICIIYTPILYEFISYKVFSGIGANNPNIGVSSPGSSNTGGSPPPGGGSNLSALGGGNQTSHSSSDSSDSSWSCYSDDVNEDDSEFTKDKKLANFVYDIECKNHNRVLDREEFNNSDLNPLNWTTSGSPLQQRTAREIESRLIYTHNSRVTRVNNGESIRNQSSFTLQHLGIGNRHPLFPSVKGILFPYSSTSRVRASQIYIYGPDLGWDRLKAIKGVQNQ